MKTEKIAVSRVIKMPGQPDVARKTNVTFRQAETAQEMLALCDGDQAKCLDIFNRGRFSLYRTKVSNALAGKTPEQRAVSKMVAAFKSINPSLSDEQVRSIVLAMPNMESAAKATSQTVPDEIDDTYFSTEAEEEDEEEETASTTK